MKHIGWFVLFLASTTFAQTRHDPAHKAGGELKHGRYVGWLELDQERIALTADFVQEAPEDFTKFPSLNAVFKMTYGGYNTHEYLTETFHDLLYDFDTGVLTFNEPQNDLVMTTEVHAHGSSTVIMGDLFVRSSAVSGKVYLKFLTDEPDEDSDDEPGVTPPPFLPLLQGQYEGKCENQRAMFQLQTVRGLKTALQGDGDVGSLGRSYGITGRLAYANSIMCGQPVPGIWCTQFNYGGGAYNPFLGKLTLHGRHSSEECDLRNGRLKCRIRIQGKSIDCDFQKLASAPKEAVFSNPRALVSPTADQLSALPPPAPPKSPDLSAALRGTFWGYLHNESNNTYQRMSLNVTPFAFTENPHNPNQLMITTTAALYLGRQAGGPFITQRYEPRSFYLRPGFTLSGPTTDSFINVTDWKKGYVTGVLYSKAFGRVGTVQLVKSALGQTPADVAVVRSFVGEFEGPMAPDGSVTPLRWFKFLFPAQPNNLQDHLIRFSGSYQAVIGITAVDSIDRGTFDPYTGNFGWILARADAATFSNGYVDADDNVKMHWPPAPDVFGAHSHDFGFETFKRQ